MDAMEELKRLEAIINTSEDGGIRSRWDSGAQLRALRGDRKQFPRGMRANLVQELGFHRTEINARMRFSEKFSTVEEVTTVISQFKTWFAIKQKALTDTPREVKTRDSRLARLLKAIDRIDPADIIDGDCKLLPELADRVRRLSESIAILSRQKAA